MERIFGRGLALACLWLGTTAMTGCLSGGGASDGGVFAGDDAGMDAEMPPGTSVRVGLPDPETGTGFILLEPDGDIVLDTFGQGGSHAELALECTGFGPRIYPQFVVENLDTGETIMTAPFSSPQPLQCDQEGTCIDSPNFVMLGGIADPNDLEGLHVRVTARVESVTGDRGEASQTGYLRRP